MPPDKTQEKAQLHGDCIPKVPPKPVREMRPEGIYEMDSGMVSELGGEARHELETRDRGQEARGDR